MAETPITLPLFGKRSGYDDFNVICCLESQSGLHIGDWTTHRRPNFKHCGSGIVPLRLVLKADDTYYGNISLQVHLRRTSVGAELRNIPIVKPLVRLPINARIEYSLLANNSSLRNLKFFSDVDPDCEIGVFKISYQGRPFKEGLNAVAGVQPEHVVHAMRFFDMFQDTGDQCSEFTCFMKHISKYSKAHIPAKCSKLNKIMTEQRTATPAYHLRYYEDGRARFSNRNIVPTTSRPTIFNGFSTADTEGQVFFQSAEEYTTLQEMAQVYEFERKRGVSTRLSQTTIDLYIFPTEDSAVSGKFVAYVYNIPVKLLDGDKAMISFDASEGGSWLAIRASARSKTSSEWDVLQLQRPFVKTPRLSEVFEALPDKFQCYKQPISDADRLEQVLQHVESTRATLICSDKSLRQHMDSMNEWLADIKSGDPQSIRWMNAMLGQGPTARGERNLFGTVEHLPMFELLRKRILTSDSFQNIYVKLRNLENGLGLFDGPSGTGKTRLMARIVTILLLNQSNKILVIANSPSAVDAAYNAVEESNSELGSVPAKLFRLCSLETNKEAKDFQRLDKVREQTLKAVRVLFGIPSLICDSSISSSFKAQTIMIDQAGLVLEIDVLMAIGKYKPDICLQFGDSIVEQPIAAHLISDNPLIPQIRMSSLKRIQLVGIRPVVMDEQWRALGGAYELWNKPYYADKVKDGRGYTTSFPGLGMNAAARQFCMFFIAKFQVPRCSTLHGNHPHHPQIFLDVESTSEQRHGSTSHFNRAHVAVLKTLLDQMHVYGAVNGLPRWSSVAIMTPYRDQSCLIQKSLEMWSREPGKMDWSLITVGTVRRFHGCEKDFVIYDTTLTDEVGLFADRHSNSTAISRSKGGLVIIGSLDNLRQVAKSKHDQEGGGRVSTAFRLHTDIVHRLRDWGNFIRFGLIPEETIKESVATLEG